MRDLRTIPSSKPATPGIVFMEEFIVLLVIVAVSAASSWLQKSRQETEEESDSIFPTETTSGRSSPHEETSGQRSSSAQETLEEWLGISTTEDEASSEEREPARETARSSRTSLEQESEPVGRFKTKEGHSEPHSMDLRHYRSQKEPESNVGPPKVDETQSHKATDFKAHAGDPFSHRHDNAYSRSIESPFSYNRKQAYRTKRSHPYGRRQPKAKSALKNALSDSGSASRLFLGSVLLGPPKALEERNSHYF